MEVIDNFGKEEVLRLTGLTYRQIDYWATTNVVVPVKPGKGKGSRRGYSFNDVVALRVAKKLKEDGISLAKIRKVLGWLRSHKEYKDLRQHLGTLKFVTDGENLFIVNRDLEQGREQIIDALNKGQYVFSITLGKVIDDLNGEIKNLIPSKQTEVLEFDEKKEKVEAR